jgi:DNA-binding MarR family transcriptional regulator
VLPLHQGGTPARKRAVTILPDILMGRVLIVGGSRSLRDNGNVTDPTPRDSVDDIVDAWERERPEIDFAPMKVLSRVWRLSKHLDRTRRAAFVTSELESWEFDVLSALRRAGSPFQLSPKSLLEQTLVSSGTMTNRIDRMTQRGLVERRTDPNDGRGILVSMTEDGRRRVDTAITELVTAEAELLARLSKADQERIAALLRKLSLDID